MKRLLRTVSLGVCALVLAGGSATIASAENAYSFLDAPTASFTLTTNPITSNQTLASAFCSDPALCSSVTFTPTVAYDEITLLDGSNFFFSPTAFTSFGAYMEQASPQSANVGAEFSNLSATVSAAPEPTTWALMFLGLGGIGLMMRRAKKTMSFRFKDALVS